MGRMYLKKRKGGDRCLPSPEQKLLLRAAILRSADAVEAWEAWKKRVDVDKVDPASHRMLPLLYRNLHKLGISDPAMGKYKGVYRQTWYKNRILFHAIVPVLRSLGNAGIRTMVLKGAALTVLYYKDYGLRPMNDFDILIRPEQALPAIGLLKTLGWRPMEFEPTQEYISVSYSHGFTNGSGQELDLHWHVLPQSRGVHADDDFWDGAASTCINDIPVHALSSTDQLLHVCIHGARWNLIPPFRWVADAMTVFDTSLTRIDWCRLIVQAEKRRLVLPLLDALNYLKETFGAPITPEIISRLEAIRVPAVERMEHRIALTAPTQWTAILDLWCQHCRLAEGSGLPHRIAGFPNFLQKIWGIPVWKLPLHGLMKTLTWHEDRMTKKPSDTIGSQPGSKSTSP